MPRTAAKADRDTPQQNSVHERAGPGAFADVRATGFLPSLSSWKDSLFSFRYTVEITNRTDVPMRVKRRYWEINDAPEDGFKRVVRVNASSVGGASKQTIEPGESFLYTTLVPLRSPGGWMEGRFTAELDGGEMIEIPVLRFDFRATPKEIEECFPNRADRYAFLDQALPREMLRLEALIDMYHARIHKDEAALTIPPEGDQSLSPETTLIFQRLLLQRFLGEYEKIEQSQSGTSLTLSEIHRTFHDIPISDIYAVSKNGTDFPISFYYNHSIRFIDIYSEEDETSRYHGIYFGQLPTSRMSQDATSDAIERELERIEVLYGRSALDVAVARRASARTGALDPGMGPAALYWKEAKAELLASHPGTHISAYLDQAGLSKPDAADRLGVTREHLYKVLRGDTSISVDMARALEAAGTGISAIGWMELQARFDLAQPKRSRISWSPPKAAPAALPAPAQTVSEDAGAPVHPGTLIGEHLARLGIPVSTAADRLGVNRNLLYQIMKAEIGISAEMAKALEAIGTGISAAQWLALQADYRLAHPRPRRPGRPRKNLVATP